MTSLAGFDAATPVDLLQESFEENGCLVMRSLAPDMTERALGELAPRIAAAPLGHDEFLGPRTRRLGGILALSAAARDLALAPVVMDLIERMFTPYTPNWQLNFSGIMHLEPGAEAQGLHRDGSIYPVRHPTPPMLIATMWALTDFTAKNGGTRVVPGSHRWDHDRLARTDDMVPVEMPAGSVLLYAGGVWHGGGANRSSGVRTGLALQYSWSWLRQEENQYLANPPEVARTYDERLARLIGYDFGGPYLGFVNGGDPHRLLKPPGDDLPQRSREELDLRSRAIEPVRLGNVEPTATPVAQGDVARGFTGPHLSRIQDQE